MLPKGVLLEKEKQIKINDSKRSDWEVELGIVIGDMPNLYLRQKQCSVQDTQSSMMCQKELIN